MAYVDRDEVRQELQTLVDESVVTDSDLDLWITDAGRLIDARIGHLYALPLPDPLPVQAMLLSTIARDFVVSRALRKHFSDRAIGEVDAWQNYSASVNAALDRVAGSDLFSGWLARPIYGLSTIASADVLNEPSDLEVLLLEYERVTGRLMSDAELILIETYPP